jgi:hypothetical protein
MTPTETEDRARRLQVRTAAASAVLGRPMLAAPEAASHQKSDSAAQRCGELR